MSVSKGPPQNSYPVDVWTQVTTLPRAHRVVPFPRMNADGVSVGDVAICVLTGDEVHLANMSASAFMRKDYKRLMGEIPKADELNEQAPAMFNCRATRELLFRSCKKAHLCVADDRGVCTTDHPALTNFFPTLEAIGRLGTDETAVLMNHYLQTQAEVGPIQSHMGVEQMEAWIEVLTVGGNSAPLALLSMAQVNALLRYTACQLSSLRTAISSPGLLPGDAT